MPSPTTIVRPIAVHLFFNCTGEIETLFQFKKSGNGFFYSRTKQELTNRYINNHSKTCLCSKCVVNAEYCKPKPHYDRCYCHDCKFPKNYVSVQVCKIINYLL